MAQSAQVLLETRIAFFPREQLLTDVSQMPGARPLVCQLQTP